MGKIKGKATEGRSESRSKCYLIPIRSIVANHNPRNPLTQAAQDSGYELFTGGPKDLWRLATSENPDERKEYVRVMDEYDPVTVQWAATFLGVGQLEPGEVRDNGAKGDRTNTYTLVFGCRRSLAILYNWCVSGTPKEPLLEAKLSPKVNETVLLHRANIENIRRDPTKIEKANAIQTALNQGQTRDEIAKLYGVSLQTVNLTLRLLELSIEDQRKVQDGSLKFTHALKKLDEAKKPVESVGGSAQTPTQKRVKPPKETSKPVEVTESTPEREIEAPEPVTDSLTEEVQELRKEVEAYREVIVDVMQLQNALIPVHQAIHKSFECDGELVKITLTNEECKAIKEAVEAHSTLTEVFDFKPVSSAGSAFEPESHLTNCGGER